MLMIGHFSPPAVPDPTADWQYLGLTLLLLLGSAGLIVLCDRLMGDKK